MLLNPTKCQGYSFYRFWAIKGKPIGGKGVDLPPPQIRVKQHAQICSKKPADIFNGSIKMGKFPDILKRAAVTPVYKKDGMNDK